MSLLPRPVRRGVAAVVGALVGLCGLPVLLATPAAADTAPLPPVTTSTVSADSLPTVQVNGVVYDQVIAGNRVYVTGSFSSARPAGAAAGTDETARANILAYDLTTGALVTSWNPGLNAQATGIDASPDGSRIYVVGQFTQAGGQTRNRIAAFDATSGALLSFNPGANSRVRSVTASGDVVYVGGIFSAVGGQPRTRIAAVSATTGAVLPWNPTVDAEVFGIVAPAGSGRVVAGGKFEYANGTRVMGLAAFDASSAALQPWGAYQVFPNYGPNAGIYSLNTDGTTVFGSGYDFGGPNPGARFEGTFAADLMTGTVNWVNGCFGDTYDVAAAAGVLYTAGHPHDCGMVGGHPQTDPWTYQYAQAYTTGPAADGWVNTYGSYPGVRAAELLHWLPTLNAGTVTGASQAAWTVTANSQYVLLGGEFPRVNGTAQAGLARFRVNGPNQQGPQGGNDMTPNLVSLAPGSVRVAWRAAWDRDNRNLTYEVLRGPSLGSSTVIGTLTSDSSWWDRPQLAFTDTAATPGSSTSYRIRVRDAFGNTVNGNPATVTVEAGTALPSPYADAVRVDAPVDYWRLGEASGTVGYDWVAGNDLVIDPSATRGTASALGDGNTATTFSGTASVPATTTAALQNAPQTFSVEAWFRTSSTAGGKIIGFGNNPNGDSSGYDRHVYMTGDGRIIFGVHPGGVRTVNSGPGYNDDRWHHVVATLGSQGMTLYVDGRRIATRADTTSAQPFGGYWRIGGDNLGGWPDASGTRFAGAIDEVAVYPSALSLARVQAHYSAAGGQPPAGGVRPTDSYGQAVYDLSPEAYWRLNEAPGTSVAADAGTFGADALYVGGAAAGEAGVIASGTAVQLDGVDDGVAAQQPVSNPTVYSQELWFQTTTTQGGKLIGFGSNQTGGSGGYDRHVYMFDDGRLTFGTWTGQTNVVETMASYNDGAWHHMVATQGPDGMRLYLDGQLVGSNPQTQAQDYTGYWRVGGDTTWGGNSSNYFAGRIDDVAVYGQVLTPAQVADHFTRGGTTTPPPVNAPPTAAFTVTPTELVAAVDGSASTDTDGTVTAWSWDFGDGGTATGATASHTYGAAGTFTVTLTVTDDDGATATTTQTVTVAATPPPVTVLAADAFARTVTGGLGTADTGGAWTVTSPASSYAVNGGTARITHTAAGALRTAYLAGVSQTSADVEASIALDKPATGGGTYVSVVGRRVGSSDDYRLKLRFLSTGAVTAQLSRTVGGTETSLASATVPGVTYAPGEVLRVRLQVTGTGPTALAARVWRAGQAEPATWQLSTTDATAALQVPGSVGIQSIPSGSSTNAPVVLTVDDVVVRPVP